jgi:hypothetical protein
VNKSEQETINKKQAEIEEDAKKRKKELEIGRGRERFLKKVTTQGRKKLIKKVREYKRQKISVLSERTKRNNITSENKKIRKNESKEAAEGDTYKIRVQRQKWRKTAIK